MIYPQILFITGRPFPQSFRRPRQVYEELHPPLSYTWACPQCGEVWARAVVPDRPFFFITHVCESCTDDILPNYMVPGSILLSGDDAFNSSLPIEVWRRELELHLNFVEKEIV